MLKISNAGCFGLSPAISSQFSVEMCAAAKNCKKKKIKPPYFRSSRSFKVIDVDTVQKLVNSACSDKQYVFIHLQLFLR